MKFSNQYAKAPPKRSGVIWSILDDHFDIVLRFFFSVKIEGTPKMRVVLACFSHCWPSFLVVLGGAGRAVRTKTKYCEDKSVPAVVIVGLALHKARSCHGAVTELSAVTAVLEKRRPWVHHCAHVAITRTKSSRCRVQHLKVS